ncbi:hypothetical protein ABVK25_010555 [Lepraria finkii]|uniref:Uncharacterized protein n=1 Tax=Lepraria finkii TaxID=1340010 RepID=A0ABR4AU31_9LECA
MEPSFGVPFSLYRHIYRPRIRQQQQQNQSATLSPTYPPPVHQDAAPLGHNQQPPQPDYHHQQGGYYPPHPDYHPQQGGYSPPHQQNYSQQGYPPPPQQQGHVLPTRTTAEWPAASRILCEQKVVAMVGGGEGPRRDSARLWRRFWLFVAAPIFVSSKSGERGKYRRWR